MNNSIGEESTTNNKFDEESITNDKIEEDSVRRERIDEDAVKKTVQRVRGVNQVIKQKQRQSRLSVPMLRQWSTRT